MKLKALLFLTLIGLSGVARAELRSINTKPGGVDGNVQYNRDGSYGGDSSFTFDRTTSNVGIATETVSTKLQLPHGATPIGACTSDQDRGKIWIDTDAVTGRQLNICEGSSGWVVQGTTGTLATSIVTQSNGTPVNSTSQAINFSTAFTLSSTGSTTTVKINGSSVTAQGNTFNTGSNLLQLSGGLVPNANIDVSSITKMGNTFNTNNNLLKLSGGVIPAVVMDATTMTATNLTQGTVPNARLDSSSVTLQGNTFNTGSKLLQLSSGLVPNANVDGSSVTKQGNTFNTGSNLLQLSGGLIPNANVDVSSITKMGNTFNAANKLLQLNSSGLVPNAQIDSSSVTLLGPSIDLSGAEATGTLAAARFPALTGDVTTSAGAVATTVAQFNVTAGTATTMSTTKIQNAGTTWIQFASTGMAMKSSDGSTIADSNSIGYSTGCSVSTNFNAGTSNQYANICSYTITPGDWDISGVCQLAQAGATYTGNTLCAISQFSGNTTTDHVKGYNQADGANPNATYDNSIAIPRWIQQVTTNTTIYLKSRSAYTGGPPNMGGSSYARKVR